MRIVWFKSLALTAAIAASSSAFAVTLEGGAVAAPNLQRLQDAYFLIKEKGVKVSDVYLDVGFKDLSHFSFAFKKTYGITPSKLSLQV